MSRQVRVNKDMSIIMYRKKNKKFASAVLSEQYREVDAIVRPPVLFKYFLT